MGGKSQPDMQGAAIAQGEANREVVRDQTFANRPDQYTPFGYTQWNPYQTTDPATGEATTAWEQVQGLTPELQDILNKQIAIQGGRSDIAGTLTGRMMDEFGAPMDWRGLNPMGDVPTSQFTLPEELQRQIDYSGATEVGDPRDYRGRAEQSIYDTAMPRLNDQFGSQREAMEIKLRNQGLGPEDAAYQAQMKGIGLQENDAMQQLTGQAIQAGRAEQAQLFGQDMGLRNMDTNEQDRQAAFFNQASNQAFGQAQAANQQNFGQAMQGSNYANQIRQQQLTEAMTKRGFSLNEINALLSGQQVGTPQMPNFSQAQAAQAAPLYQAAGDQASIDAANNPFGAILGAGSALGAAALGNTALFTP